MRWMWVSMAGELKVGRWLRFWKMSWESREEEETFTNQPRFMSASRLCVLRKRQVALRCEWSFTYLMGDDGNSGVVQVEPGRDLPVGDDEDVAHPGGVSLHRAQRVAELLVVLEAARRHVLVLLGLDGNQRTNRT